MTITVNAAENRFHEGDSSTTPNALNSFTVSAGSDRMLVLFFMGGGRSTSDRATTDITATIDGNSFTHLARDWSTGSYYQYAQSLILKEADFPSSDGDYNITFTAGACVGHASTESRVVCFQLEDVAQDTPSGSALSAVAETSGVTTHDNSVTTPSSSGGEHIVIGCNIVDKYLGNPTSVTAPSGFTSLYGPSSTGTDDHWFSAHYVKEASDSQAVDVDYTSSHAFTSASIALAIAEAGSGGIEGSLSETQDSNTLFSTGELDLSGTLGVTQGSDTLSGSAELDVQGSLSATQDSDTLSANGTLGDVNNGSLSVTQDSNTVTSTGELDIAGSATPTQDNQTLSAQAELDISGSLSISQDGDTLTASAVIGSIEGSLNATQDDNTLEAYQTAPTPDIDLGGGLVNDGFKKKRKKQQTQNDDDEVILMVIDEFMKIAA